jgi:hypothetical protein
MLVKVRFKRPVDRFPHFSVPKGATGTLVLLTSTEAAVKLDLPMPGAEEWDNCVYWNESTPDEHCDLAQMNEDLEIVA